MLRFDVFAADVESLGDLEVTRAQVGVAGSLLAKFLEKIFVLVEGNPSHRKE